MSDEFDNFVRKCIAERKCVICGADISNRYYTALKCSNSKCVATTIKQKMNGKLISLEKLKRVILEKVCYWDVIPMDKCDKVVNDKKWFEGFIAGRDAAVDVLNKELNLNLAASKQAVDKKDE